MRAKGLELGLASPINTIFSIATDLSYTNVSVDNGPSELRRRPKWLGSISLEADFEDVSFILFTDFRDAYLDSSIATGLVELGGYATYGLSANWAIRETTTLTFNAQNIFARETEESVGFINNAINVRMGFRYIF